MEEITAAELEHEIRDGRPITIVDVRRAEEFERWHIDPGAAELVNLPAAESENGWQALAAGRELRIVCNRGNTSGRVAAELARRGIPARSVGGGMLAWSRLLVAAAVDIGSRTTVIQFRREARGCLSYLVARGRQALVVDPAPEVAPYLDRAGALGVTVTAVLDTHVHADHLSGARLLADSTGARLHLSRAAVARGVAYADRVQPIDDGDRFGLDEADLQVMALPGHTTDNVGLLVDRRALVCGDSLFAGAVARPDLEAGDAGAAAAAATLHRTLHERVLSLPPETLVLPCHYPGGRLAEASVTTVGEALDRVAPLRLNVDGFVAAVLGSMPPRPANHLAIIAANLGRDGGAGDGSLEVGANNCAAY